MRKYKYYCDKFTYRRSTGKEHYFWIWSNRLWHGTRVDPSKQSGTYRIPSLYAALRGMV